MSRDSRTQAISRLSAPGGLCRVAGQRRGPRGFPAGAAEPGHGQGHAVAGGSGSLVQPPGTSAVPDGGYRLAGLDLPDTAGRDGRNLRRAASSRYILRAKVRIERWDQVPGSEAVFGWILSRAGTPQGTCPLLLERVFGCTGIEEFPEAEAWAVQGGRRQYCAVRLPGDRLDRAMVLLGEPPTHLNLALRRRLGLDSVSDWRLGDIEAELPWIGSANERQVPGALAQPRSFRRGQLHQGLLRRAGDHRAHGAPGPAQAAHAPSAACRLNSTFAAARGRNTRNWEQSR